MALLQLRSCTHGLTPWIPDRITVEATGGCPMSLAVALQTAGLPVAMLNPRRVWVSSPKPTA